MKILLDMNISPSWVPILKKAGFEAIHWSEVGKPDAPDKELFNWALVNEYIIFTHDLDFGTMLALTKGKGPSVIQIRTQNVTTENLSTIIIQTIQHYKKYLNEGALIIIDENKLRVRILPL